MLVKRLRYVGIGCGLLLSLGGVARAAAAPSESELPLQPIRTVRFETDEGTWMSLDVSPDGKTIVFELLGDLYTLPIEGGRATRITEGLAFDSQPRYSPDGRSIVFVSDRTGSDNLWVSNRDGRELRAVTREKNTVFISPQWTRDGRAIVASKAADVNGRENWASHGEVPLYLYPCSGGSAGLKISGGDFQAVSGVSDSGGGRYLGATFAPDGELFAAANQGGMEDGAWQIVSFDRDTARPRFRTGAPGSAMRPLISPNGEYLVYATRVDEKTELKIQDLGTGRTRTLVPEATRDAQREGAFDARRDLMPGAAFTPDGSALVVSYGGKLWRVEVARGIASPIAFTAVVEQQLGALASFEYPMTQGMRTARQIRHATPSPDGKRLVFTALDRLWIMNLANGVVRRLTPAQPGEYFPAWSPDGRYVAYATWREADGGHLYRMRADGRGQPERLTRVAAYYERVSYTPDGTRLFAARSSRQAKQDSRKRRWRNETRQLPDTDLVAMPASGGEVTSIMPLTSAKAQSSASPAAAQFSSRSDRIHIYDYHEGLVSSSIDGSDRRSILKVTGSGQSGGRMGQVPADDVVLSPDGRHALALVNEQVYVIALPAWVKAQTPAISVDEPSSAALPVVRITDAGGEFPGWASEGRAIFYSLGRSFYQMPFDAAVFKELGEARERQAERVVRTDVQLNVPGDEPSGAILLRGARLITMKGDQILDDAEILIRGSRIAALGLRGTVRPPAAARIVDVSGATIIPGFIDVHAKVVPDAGVHDAQPWEYQVNLAYGVTSLREATPWSSDYLSYADRIDAGEITGPRVFSNGRALSAEQRWTSIDDARGVLKRYSEHYGTHTVRQVLLGDRDVRQWFVIASRELGLMPVAQGGGDLKMLLTLAADGYAALDGASRTFPLYRDVVELLARSGSAYTLGSLVTQSDYYYRKYDVRAERNLMRFTPWEEIEAHPFRGRAASSGDAYTFAQKAADAARFVGQGGLLAVSSRGVLQGLGFHWELWATQSGGLSPHDALRAATWSGASVLGVQNDLGSLEPGKLADLVVLAGDPLQDITNTNTVRYVMKHGRLYEAASLRRIESGQGE